MPAERDYPKARWRYNADRELELFVEMPGRSKRQLERRMGQEMTVWARKQADKRGDQRLELGTVIHVADGVVILSPR